MAVDDAALQARILFELGQQQNTALALAFDSYLTDGKSLGQTDYQVYLYTRRAVIVALLGPAAVKVNYKQGPVSADLGEEFDHLLKLLAETDALLAQQAASRGGKIGQITRTEPIQVTDPDTVGPNARTYRGDPIMPSLTRIGEP